jgi:hypothetical protein
MLLRDRRSAGGFALRCQNGVFGTTAGKPARYTLMGTSVTSERSAAIDVESNCRTNLALSYQGLEFGGTWRGKVDIVSDGSLRSGPSIVNLQPWKVLSERVDANPQSRIPLP